MFKGLAVGGICGLLLAVTAAAAPAQTTDPTLLVLQPSDVPGLTVTGPPQLSNQTLSPKTRGRVSGADATYYLRSPLNGLRSRAEVFRDATAAHQALLEASAALARSTQLEGRTVSLGQEGLSYNHIVLGYNFVWRQGNVLSFLNARLGRGPGSDGNDYVKLANSRVLAQVPAANPGPPVAVKPVVGRPTALPAQPKAGKPFAVTFPVTWSDDGSVVTTGTVLSKVSVASKTVPHNYAFRAGQLKLTLKVPKTSRGGQLKVTATVRADNKAGTRTVAFRVR